jgi:tetratricopeptide (TPR) repeat protein
MTTNIIANRYEVLDQLGAGGMGVVWLVRDKLRNQKVALKQVLTQDDDQRLAITREFRTLSTLRHPNIVSVIEYGFHDAQPYFTMEYLPDAKAFDKASDRKIEHLTQVLQALGYLHRRGILHRDLKPGNVLITSDGVVKVLDFGLALDTMRDQSSEIGGTLRYMAPELFMEEPASVGSDLWALGVMICEMDGNRHPFHTEGGVSEQIMSIVSNPPDLSGIEGELAGVVSRLLSKNKAERYPSALDVIRDLHAVYKIQLPLESQSHRESFLQAAAFVGREHEYQCLTDALKAAAGGTRQLWLIGGEAGVGKSRLLDELRTRALVDGFIVLQGQGVENGGLPYQLWREVARKLVIGTPISDLTASVLKELVPDIAALIDREVPALAPLEPQANRDRLMAALLERLNALDAPVLIILEDLHWAKEGLDLLKLLLPHIDTMRGMIVGSYRNDERPTLPEELPETSLLTLARLSPEAIADLSASMIGAENATPELVERLVKETEGNALFMVEVMRALAEEAGSLQDITRRSLPERILAGGMFAVLQRRLMRVPEWALGTLKLAAVIGRVIDIPALKAAGVTNIDQWLQVCADASILEPYHGEWRFSHDRLREVLLKDSENLAKLHEQAALALEAVYPDNVDYAEALAEHWHIAGNPEREIAFILKAAEHLVNISGDYERAENLAQRGLDLNLPHTRAELLLWKGFSAEKQGQYETAIDLYQTGLTANPTSAIKVLLLNRSGHICLRQGKYAEAEVYARQAREIAGNHDEHTSLHLLGLVARYQGDFVAAKTYYEESLRIRRQLGSKKGVADSLNNLGMVALHQGDYPAARTFFEDSLHIRREIGDRQGTAISLNNLGVIAIYQGDYAAAQVYFEDVLQINRKIGDVAGVAGSLNNLGGMAQAQGKIVEARAYYEESLQINRRIGDKQNAAVSLHNLGVLADVQGDFEAARNLYEECLQIAREIGNPETIIYGTAGLVMVLTQTDERETARELLIESLKTALETDTIPMMLYALLGAACWSQDDEQVVTWIGVMLEQGSTEIKDDIRFKSLTEKIRRKLGDERVNAAVEAGKSLDVRAEAEHLLAALTQPLEAI